MQLFKTILSQGLRLWRFRAKVAILKDQWRQTFGGDSPLKKWRFWKLWGRRQKVAILGRKLAILGQKVAIFGPFLGGKISSNATLNFRQKCVQKSGDFGAKFAQKWRFLD